MSKKTKSRLTAAQIVVAELCREIRPPVFEGTNVVANTSLRNAWYDTVKKRARAAEVSDAAWSEFCDVAGVPD